MAARRRATMAVALRRRNGLQRPSRRSRKPLSASGRPRVRIPPPPLPGRRAASERVSDHRTPCGPASAGGLFSSAGLGRRQSDRTCQPSRLRAPRLPHAGRAELLRKIAIAEALRTPRAPEAPAMTNRRALRPHCAAKRPETDRQPAVRRATRIDHDADKYGSPLTGCLRLMSCLADARTPLDHAAPRRSSLWTSCASMDFARRPRLSGSAAAPERLPAGVSHCPKQREGRPR
jgi:hypothetical protein